ncbi:hypothetical protein B0H10DRAFT_2187938 [Mycena sp. CBHHK59/15]|nr:hypothetical protein B0H10DRAFT_2187938 [Mycena sp. CBHHK59/15]
MYLLQQVSQGHIGSKENFEIPQSIHYDIIPSPMMSIAKALEFPMPLKCIPNDSPQPCQYFSMAAPDIMDKNMTVQRLRHLPIPEAKVIRKLSQHSRQAWLDGYQSVMYSHLGGVVAHCPLWLISVWVAFLDFKRDVQGPWVKSSDWLAQRKKVSKRNPALVELVDEVRQILSMLPWGCVKPAGLSDTEAAFNLWCFLRPNWLASSQQNNILELICQKVDADPALTGKIRVEGVDLTPKIIEVFKAGADTYRTARSFQWIRELFDDLLRNKAALITTTHLGEITKEPHWVGLMVNASKPVTQILYADSFGKTIPPSLFAAFRWVVDQHTTAAESAGKLPVGPQQDGFSCGMLVDNSLQHFVDPAIPLSKAGEKFARARLVAFNTLGKWMLERLEIARAAVIREDEDSQSDSVFPDPSTASSNSPPTNDDSDSDSDGPTFLFRRNAKHPYFSHCLGFSGRCGVKQPKGHKDSPTPAPNPRKKRIYKRGVSNTPHPPSPLLFPPASLPPRPQHSDDVFGPTDQGDGYGTDSESDGAGRACSAADLWEEYAWGPEDDAALPPDCQMGEFDTSEPDSLAFLNHSSGDEGGGCGARFGQRIDRYSPPSPTESAPSTAPPRPPAVPSAAPPVAPSPTSHTTTSAASEAATSSSAGPKSKITAYWKVETAAEKAVCMEREAREYTGHAEENHMQEVNATRIIAGRKGVDNRERQQRFRDRKKAELIAEGWVPGQKRKRVATLVAVNEMGQSTDVTMAELSHPRRQFNKDAKKNNKPSGRKLKEKNKKKDAKLTNWKKLGLPPTQVAIWKIDCWSVHKSKDFRDWMKKNHPYIIILFIPGGCTSIAQPLNVGIQHLMKLSIKRSAHQDIVEEASVQILAGKSATEIKLNTTVSILRDRSVGWIVQAIKDISDPALIMKAFEMCKAGEFNFSHASLTSQEALGWLRQLPKDDPVLHAELMLSSVPLPAGDAVKEEPFLNVNVYDDCDIPLDVLSDMLHGVSAPGKYSVDAEGGLTCSGDAEKSDAEDDSESEAVEVALASPVILRRGQRKKTENKRYRSELWEGH